MTVETLDKLVAFSKDNTDALVKSSTAAFKGIEELSKVGQSLATKAVSQTDAAVKALTAVKSPVELVDVQGRLAREAVEAAIADGRQLFDVLGAVYTSAFEPIKDRFVALQSLVKAA